jgi:hypothetical protein
VLADGTILRTKVSHGRSEIGDQGLWRRIWREQLGLASEDAFWQALRERRPVDRGDSAPAPPAGPSIPGWVVVGLLRAGVDEADLRGLTPDEAQRRLEEIWARPGDEADR